MGALLVMLLPILVQNAPGIIDSIRKVFEDAKTKGVITSEQHAALIALLNKHEQQYVEEARLKAGLPKEGVSDVTK